MVVRFDDISDESKLWIYQSNRPFKDELINSLEKKISQFLSSWTSHGSELNSAFTIKYNLFLFIALDENNSNATGCSIDKLMSFIKILEKEYSLRLLDRLDISYRKGNDIIVDRLNDFKKKVLNKEVNENTIVFNNLIKFKKDMTQNWELCAKDSWHQQLFK